MLYGVLWMNGMKFDNRYGAFITLKRLSRGDQEAARSFE